MLLLCDELEWDAVRPGHHLDLDRIDDIRRAQFSRVLWIDPANNRGRGLPFSVSRGGGMPQYGGEEAGRNASGYLLRQSPSSLAIISFMISDVPAPMVYRRRSRQ